MAGLDHSDAADICGVTPEALRQRLHRAREALSKALERDAAEAEPRAFHLRSTGLWQRAVSSVTGSVTIDMKPFNRRRPDTPVAG
jgi:hypothetical protein